MAVPLARAPVRAAVLAGALVAAVCPLRARDAGLAGAMRSTHRPSAKATRVLRRLKRPPLLTKQLVQQRLAELREIVAEATHDRTALEAWLALGIANAAVSTYPDHALERVRDLVEMERAPRPRKVRR